MPSCAAAFYEPIRDSLAQVASNPVGVLRQPSVAHFYELVPQLLHVKHALHPSSELNTSCSTLPVLIRLPGPYVDSVAANVLVYCPINHLQYKRGTGMH